jgi:hypothetical protein
MKTFGDWKRAIRKLGYPEAPRAERRNPPGIAARYGSHSETKFGQIRNISTSGIFLETADRWPIGKVIPLTLQREHPTESPSDLKINVQVRIVAHGQEGVGASFILPEGLDPQLWEALVDHMDVQPEPEHVAFIFRLVRTILFICRLCPTGSQDLIQSLAKGLDASRTETAIQIALGAEKLLARDSSDNANRCHPQIVASVLKDGSWSNDQVLRQLWSGLLASSCTPDGKDLSNFPFVELLVQVTVNQSRIFVTGCRNVKSANGGITSNDVVITPEEIMGITGVTDFYRNATDVSYLYQFGLLKKEFDFTTYTPKDLVDITPSSLGLKLFDLCQGPLLTAGVGSR